MRVVLDTSVLIAALRSSHGAAAEILRLVDRQEVTLVLDLKLALEYKDVCERPANLQAFSLDSSELNRFLLLLIERAEEGVVVDLLRPVSADPDDDMVIELAVAGQVSAIITNNAKHLNIAFDQFGIPVLSPSEFLHRRRKGAWSENAN